MSGPAVRIAAQAKINLHLRVLARDESGFHSIETIFHRIDLADDLEIEATASERTLDVTGTDTGPVESNLAWRAAEAYAQRNAWPGGFRIALTKQIPVGAGLGGGSADAAAVLRALNSMSPRPMSPAELSGVAATLGSDVPFLASDAVMALGWGRGERLKPLSAMPQRDLALISPGFAVSTADAYRWLDEDRARESERVGRPRDASRAFDAAEVSSWSLLAEVAENDFEAPVMSRHPGLREDLERLSELRAILARMTGSGSTLFGVFDSPPDASRLTTTRTSANVVPAVRVG